jgi:hypothetical protein
MTVEVYFGNGKIPRKRFGSGYRNSTTPDGSILPCTYKSQLTYSLEKLGKTNETQQGMRGPSLAVHDRNIDKGAPSQASSTSLKIVFVDGMVLVQQMTKKPGQSQLLKISVSISMTDS